MERLLSQLAETVTGAEDLEGLARPLLELLQAVTGMESTYLTRVDEAVGLQHIVFSRNSSQMRIPEGLSVPWGDTLCKRALEEGKPYTDDVEGCWGDSGAARELGIKTYLSTPVRHADGELFGTLCAASPAKVPVSEDARKVLDMFAKLLTQQIDREKLVGTLRKRNADLSARALTDPLTGIPNRRALTDALAQAMGRAARDGDLVQVAFIDLDGFKGINDRFGHEAGDRFLKAVAERLAASTRASEVVARYGGDEFVLVATESGSDNLKARLERVIAGHYELGETRIDYPGASVGLVTAHVGESPADLLSRADASMYDIKRQRRAAAGTSR